jgi:hypothetical protein
VPCFSAKPCAARWVPASASPHRHDRSAKRKAPAATPTPREPSTAHHSSARRRQPPASTRQTSLPASRHRPPRPRTATPGPHNGICPPQRLRPENRQPRTTRALGAGSHSPTPADQSPAHPLPRPCTATPGLQNTICPPQRLRPENRPPPQRPAPAASSQNQVDHPPGHLPAATHTPRERPSAHLRDAQRRQPPAGPATRPPTRRLPQAHTGTPRPQNTIRPPQPVRPENHPPRTTPAPRASSLSPTPGQPASNRHPHPPDGLHRSTKRRQMPAPYGRGER